MAVAWCASFARAAGVRLPGWLLLVLALAAWSCYVLDRLMDVRRSGLTCPHLRERHHFHWAQRRWMLPAAVLAAATALVVASHSMPASALERNSLLAASALTYFGMVNGFAQAPSRSPKAFVGKGRALPKEFLVGILFTASCALPVWARMGAGRMWLIPVFLVFASLAWLNCHAIEAWESSPDRHRERAQIEVGCLCLASAALLLMPGAMFCDRSRLAMLLGLAAMSAVGIWLLDRNRLSLDPVSLRSAADLVLLTAMGIFLLP